MKNVLYIFFLPLVFLFSTSAHAADFQGKVIHVTDGDTITVLNDPKKKILKLWTLGRDCEQGG